MAKTTARWIKYDLQSLTGSSTLTVYLKASGGLERTADGIQIASSGVINDMLAGSIGLDKLIKAVVAADGTVPFTANQDMGGNRLTNMAQAQDPEDAINLAQLQTWSAGLDFQADVLATQEDSTLDPGSSPSEGDRYIITNSADLHTNFGTVTDLADNDIVEYKNSEFVVAYDISVKGEGAVAWDRTNDYFQFWDGSTWRQHGGLTGVTAGDGLGKNINTIFVEVADFAGTGLEDNGSNDLQISSQGNGLAGGNGSLLSVDPDGTSGGDISPVTVGANGVGVDVTSLDGDHLGVDFTPSNYSPDASPTEANDVDDLAAHLQGIDTALLTVGLKTVDYKEITSTMSTNGFFSLSPNPKDPVLVSVTPIGGPQQVNKRLVGTTGAVPDFDVLNTNEVHINNNGSASGLSGNLQTGDILMVEYEVD